MSKGNTTKDYRINGRIRAPKVRVIDENGVQLGIMTVPEALERARAKTLDLVEVAPQAEPPVCRMMDYGKFKYDAAQKARVARKASRVKAAPGLREVRMKPRIAKHDLSGKSRLVKRFLDHGAKVKVSVLFRGREIDHPERGMELLKNVADSLEGAALLERAPVLEGRTLSMTLAPAK